MEKIRLTSLLCVGYYCQYLACQWRNINISENIGGGVARPAWRNRRSAAEMCWLMLAARLTMAWRRLMLMANGGYKWRRRLTTSWRLIGPAWLTIGPEMA